MRNKMRYFLICGGLLALLISTIPGIGADNTPDSKHRKANYELASQWTPQKVGRLVFDTAVTPHWLESGDRFWYTFENNKGRKFYIVDPVKKTKTYVFDPVKLAASLTTATGIPYDSQHLPITVIRFLKNDSAIQFEINVPREAIIPGEKKSTAVTTATEAAQQQQEEEELDVPQQQGGRGGAIFAPPPGRDQKQLSFEYELLSGRLQLLDERPVRKPAWASVSPDGKTVVFARNRNLYTMDEANYAKAVKDANDRTIVETQLTTDGIEDFAYGGRGGAGGQQQDQQQQDQQQQQDNSGGEQGQEAQRNVRGPANVAWARDSKKFALIRRDSRKIPKLWVINALANPRPALETYSYAMPGEANTPQSQVEVFDLASKKSVDRQSGFI